MRTTERLSILSLCLLLLVAFSPGRSFGQAVYGSIFGTVTDAQGAAVPGAKVTITDLSKNTGTTVETNATGNYTATRLIPGTYRVKVEAPNFKTAILDNVVVNVDTASPADFQLTAGAVTEEVTITAEAPLLKTDRADVATTFESRQVTDLPILDRNFTKFILLTPGTQQLQWQHAASENPQGSTQTMVNGQNFSGTGYQLDGTENRDPILGIIVINPNFESIGETKITSQNYDAEFGQAIAGVASVSTRSGTNNLHGAVYLFRQNDLFQARNPFSQASKNPQTNKFIPDTLRNQFGGAVGGRIIRDRLFFFGDYDGLRSKTGGSRLLTVPTAAARTITNGFIDLSGYLGDVVLDSNKNPIPVQTVSGATVNLRQNMIFDPTSSADPNSRRVFDGNRIPSSRVSQQALNVLKLIPLPNAPGTFGGTTDNFVAAGIEGFDKDSFDVRIDYKSTEKLSMFGRYSFADFTRNGPTAFGQGGGPELVSLGGTSKVRNQSVAYGFDYSWNPTLVTDFRFGFFRYKVNVLPFDFGKNTATDAGIRGLNNDSFSSGLPAFFIDGNNNRGGSSFGSGLGVNRCNCPLDQDENQFQYVSNTTKFVGNHTFKFGIDVRRAYNLRVPSDTHRAGELSFNNNRTGHGTLGQGLGLATFLLGDVTNFGRYISSSTDARERQWRHFYYGQDSWRASQKLTINYGLRLDVINPQSINAPGNAGFLSLETGQIRTVGFGTTDLNGNVTNSLNFAPRLSLAYKFTDKLVVRAGYGRSYDIGVFGSVFGHSVTQNLPVLASQQVNNGSFNRAFNLADGAPAFTQFYGLDKAPKDPTAKANTTLPSNGVFFLPNNVFSRVLPDKMRLPTVDAWNFTVQYQLTNKMSIEAAYVANKGTHVFAGDGPAFDANQVPITGYTPGRNGNDFKPYFRKFGWTQGIDYFCNCADNHYNSLQLKVDKRFSDGYSILAHYTYQNQVQEDGGYFFYDASLNRGPAGWQRDHNFVFSQVYELPIGKGKRFGGSMSRAADLLVGGWQVNSNTTIQSGLPFDNCIDTSGISDTGTCRPDVKGEVKTGVFRDSNGQIKYFKDLSVFSKPTTPGTFGNQKRNALRGPGYWRTDASLFKKFKLTERSEAEFRVEAVNVFNHVNLGNPDTFIGSFTGSGGIINSTAYFGADPQRNLQFALRIKF
ncbi:MAG TPA: TonB-dependent receptor [Blastocatellia bacterium]|nr:TonB-dependent receptor [Blastocatellia bacterium]